MNIRHICSIVVPMSLYLKQKNWVMDISIPKNGVVAIEFRISHLLPLKYEPRPVK